MNKVLKRLVVSSLLIVFLVVLSSCSQVREVVCPDASPLSFGASDVLNESPTLLPTGASVVNVSLDVVNASAVLNASVNASSSNTSNVSASSSNVSNASAPLNASSVNVSRANASSNVSNASLNVSGVSSGLVFVEGDIVRLSLNVSDPDGDPVSLSFSNPLNVSGAWATKDGDAGTYTITILASDGKSSVNRTVTLMVKARNKPPVITVSDVTVKEGETVRLNVSTVDPDGDPVSIAYSGWMSLASKSTDYSSAGKYSVTITVTAGAHTSVKNVSVIVENVNRPPSFTSVIIERNMTEGSAMSIVPSTIDPDGDTVSLSYSVPFNQQGFWQSKDGDAGAYNVTMTASDGFLNVSESFLIIVRAKNKPPVIEVSDVKVKEGVTVSITPVVKDPEGQATTITYSGWMSSSTKETSYSDAGKYQVTISASDGENVVSKSITVTVDDVNRPPVFVG